MGADQQSRGVHAWTLITLRRDGFSMEIIEGIAAVQDKWRARRDDPNVRAIYAYGPDGTYYDSWTNE